MVPKHETRKRFRQHAVIVLYITMLSQSQLCNWLQQDVANSCCYLGLSNTGISAVHDLGLAICSSNLYRQTDEDGARHLHKIDTLVQKGIDRSDD